MADINQMAQFVSMSHMWNHMDPYGQYPLVKDEKSGAFASNIAALHAASMASSRTVTPPQRRKANPVPSEHKDEAYFERRRKNNDSAKRSRENRRQKEQEYQLKAEFLQHENTQLREVIKQLQTQIQYMRSQMATQQFGFNG